MLKELNLPEYSFKTRGKEGEEMILDTIRRKYVRLTPEEWVRQNFVHYLIDKGKYPPGLISIEVMVPLNRIRKRVDILVHNRRGKPVMIVECKEPDFKLEEKVFDQIVVYNMSLKVPYLVVTNGMHHYALRVDHEENKWDYLLAIPLYEDIS